MGANHFQPSSSDLKPHYTSEIHPVQGEVPLYRLKGQSLFLFSVPTQSPMFAKLAETIQQQKQRSLCSYFGNLFKKEAASSQTECFCGKQDQLYTFWTYNNQTLADQTNYNVREGKYPTESELWELIDSLSQAAITLANFGIFIDFDFKNVHFSPKNKIELYWGNAKVGNGHRSFYKLMTARQKSCAGDGFSPQQLLAIAKRKMTEKFDLGKCVIHSLGRIVLLYAHNLKDFGQIIDYHNYSFRNKQVSLFLKYYKQRYSNKLFNVLSEMLEVDPSQRISLTKLRNFLQSQSYKALIRKLESKRESVETSPTNTCESSKVSVRVSQF